MFEDIKSHVKNWDDDGKERKNYLDLILNKKAFDKSGSCLRYGDMLYSVSDPRALKFFKRFVEKACRGEEHGE